MIFNKYASKFKKLILHLNPIDFQLKYIGPSIVYVEKI